MAGHSKWANIKFRKSAQDAKRGKIFTKLIREITVAAQIGGAEESTNSRLRDAIAKALKANMKRDTIDNAIKRGAGGSDDANMVEMRYEGYAPGGIAIIVDCLSDNKNRTVSEVRHAFTKFGGNLGTDGSVAYLFSKRGEILLAPTQETDKAIDLAMESGAEDVGLDEGQVEVITRVENFHEIKDKFESSSFEIEASHLTMHAQTLVPVEKVTAETLIKLIDMLEDLDDVQDVYTNAANLHEFAGE
jgi:YebC/PmpR family DNA-binding regulatory protein